MLFDSHGGVEQGLGDGVGTPIGVPDENIQELLLPESSLLVAGVLVVQTMLPGKPPQLPDSSVDCSGSGMLGVDGCDWLSW